MKFRRTVAVCITCNEAQMSVFTLFFEHQSERLEVYNIIVSEFCS